MSVAGKRVEAAAQERVAVVGFPIAPVQAFCHCFRASNTCVIYYCLEPATDTLPHGPARKHLLWTPPLSSGGLRLFLRF